VLDWPEPLGALVSLLLAGLFGVVALIALVQTAISRRRDRWPHLRGRIGGPDQQANQDRPKDPGEQRRDNGIPR
jgi:hypothetical protein